MGTRGVGRAAGQSPEGEAGLEAARGAGTATVTVEATEGARLVGEAAMPAAEAAAMTAMAPAEGTP